MLRGPGRKYPAEPLLRQVRLRYPDSFPDVRYYRESVAEPWVVMNISSQTYTRIVKNGVIKEATAEKICREMGWFIADIWPEYWQEEVLNEDEEAPQPELIVPPQLFVYTSELPPTEVFNMDAFAIAHICHEANRALQIEQADPSIPVAPLWEATDNETKTSIISGVQGIIAGNTPEQSHAAWREFKLAHGWKYGPVKDEAKKEHPLICGYASLPESQQIKDHLFSAIVKVLENR